MYTYKSNVAYINVTLLLLIRNSFCDLPQCKLAPVMKGSDT